jgi:hypothetical protein
MTSKFVLHVLACACIAFSACGKKPAASPSSQQTSPTSNAAASESDASKTLDRLTQAVRKYAAETQSAPKSLNDLVAAGYLTELPEAPAGKKFIIDQNLRVQLQ